MRYLVPAIVIGWAITVIAAAGFGYHYRTVNDQLRALRKWASERRQKPAPIEPTSKVIDPDDPTQQIKKDFEDTTRKLNS